MERNTSGKVVSEKWTTAPSRGQRGAHHRHRPSEAGGGHPLPGYSQLASEDTEGAACVVMDVNRAEVLASASYPSYHLATYSARFGGEQR